MTRLLVSVGFDADRYIAPSRKAVRSIELGAPDAVGWSVEVDDNTVTITSPPVSRVPDVVTSLAAKQDPPFRAASARMVTVIPRHLCVLTYAEVEEASAVPVEVAPSPEPEHPSIAQAPLTNAPSPAVAAPAPTRRRPLPPGAKPDVTPPPSRIGILDVGQPIAQGVARDPLFVEER